MLKKIVKILKNIIIVIIALLLIITIVEPFGYGFSDKTTKERSVENIVNETRDAL